MELSFHRLRLLRELQRRGTVTAAAEELNYTVSAVSQQLAQLEREANTALYERRGRRIVLTEAGLVLAEHAHLILNAVDAAAEALEAAGDGMTATVTAGVWASVAAELLPGGLAILAEKYPGVTVRTRELAPEDTVGAVRDGSLDLAFVIDYSSYLMPEAPHIHRRVVAVEQMHAAVPVAAIEAGTIEASTIDSGQVSLSTLAGQPWILSGPRSHFGRAVRMVCRDAGFEPEVRHEVGEQTTALSMVAAGLGVTMVSDLGSRLLPRGVQLLPLVDHFTRTVSVSYRARDDDRTAITVLTDAIAQAARDLGIGVEVADPANEH